MDVRKVIGMSVSLGVVHSALAIGVEKPNIVLIYADDMGFGELACQNPDALAPTPYLDKLCAEGMRFTDAHAGASVCTPARYGLLTGRYSWRTSLKGGVLWHYDAPLIKPERQTIGDMLRDTGYTTGMIGKWHLGWNWPLKQGMTLPEKKSERKKAADRIDWTKPITGGPVDCGFDSYWGEGVINIGPYSYIKDRHVVEIPVPSENKKQFYAAPSWDDVKVLPDVTREAVRYIEDHSNNSKPFFLYFSLPSPHKPHVPAEQFQGKTKIGVYGDYIYQTDWAVGQVMESLEKAGVRDNTLIIFTSDNGPENIVYKLSDEYKGYHSSGELRGVKRDLWEGGHRVPFIASWPERISKGSVSDETISQLDLFASLAALTGGRLAKGAASDSFDILPAFFGSKVDRSSAVPIIHHRADRYAIRQGDWVYIDHKTGAMTKAKSKVLDTLRGYTKHSHPGELFNLAEDISQKNNLYGTYPERVKKMKSLLDTMLAAEASVSR